MKENNLDHLGLPELMMLSKQINQHISTMQAELQQSDQRDQATQSYYIILGPHTSEPYEVTPLPVTPSGKYHFLLDTPDNHIYMGSFRKWDAKEIKARTLERAHAKAKRKIQKRDQLLLKDRQAMAWTRQHATGLEQ